MPIISANIGGNEHSFACADGQEDRFRALVHKLNVRIDKITKMNSKANEMRILVLVCLLMEDEIDDMKKNKTVEGAREASKDNQSLVGTMDSISEYLENLANKIETM